jgi:Flp pilus assembly protein TadG
MKLIALATDVRGASAVEFGLAFPAFAALLAGTLGGGLLLWTQLGLQHGVVMAARCASVNSRLCGSSSAIQSYAAQQTYGVNPAPSVFTWSVQSCGNQVTASLPIQTFASYFGSVTLTAEACFAK